ncbi:hypothetical protein GWA97_13680 [Flavobacterium sp. LaA7.5]|nr:hypothetical protein [Flavobacterium salilacus subsp. altitudinum]
MKKIILVFVSILLTISCNESNPYLKRLNEDFKFFKSKFEPYLISHFPKTINNDNNFLICNTDVKNHYVNFFLIESDVKKERLDSVSKMLNDNPHVTKYKSNQSCLLKIKKETKDFLTLSDTCFINKPIPDFSKYPEIDKFYLKSTYDIYVIDAKPGDVSAKFYLKPMANMPANWENGYSKGITIDYNTKRISYWTIIW